MTRDMKRIQAPQDCTLLLFYFPRTPEACALGLIEGRIRKMFFVGHGWPAKMLDGLLGVVQRHFQPLAH